MATLKWQIKSYDVGIAQAGQLEVFIPTYLVGVGDIGQGGMVSHHQHDHGTAQIVDLPDPAQSLAPKVMALSAILKGNSAAACNDIAAFVGTQWVASCAPREELAHPW